MKQQQLSDCSIAITPSFATHWTLDLDKEWRKSLKHFRHEKRITGFDLDGWHKQFSCQTTGKTEHVLKKMAKSHARILLIFDVTVELGFRIVIRRGKSRAFNYEWLLTARNYFHPDIFPRNLTQRNNTLSFVNTTSRGFCQICRQKHQIPCCPLEAIPRKSHSWRHNRSGVKSCDPDFFIRTSRRWKTHCFPLGWIEWHQSFGAFQHCRQQPSDGDTHDRLPQYCDILG